MPCVWWCAYLGKPQKPCNCFLPTFHLDAYALGYVQDPPLQYGGGGSGTRIRWGTVKWEKWPKSEFLHETTVGMSDVYRYIMCIGQGFASPATLVYASSVVRFWWILVVHVCAILLTTTYLYYKHHWCMCEIGKKCSKESVWYNKYWKGVAFTKERVNK